MIKTTLPAKVEFRVALPTPANDNVLSHPRPLTAADMQTILDKHGRAIGAAIDAVSQERDPSADPSLTMKAVLLRLPEVQRWIVWYGSNLKRQEVVALEEGVLTRACAEVITTTLTEYCAESALEYLISGLREFSTYLSRAGSTDE